MPETTPPNTADAGLEMRTYFVRERNALTVRADFGELFVDYYLHLSANQIKVAPEPDRMFKRALAAFTLHSASRPRNELIAWTINFQQPLVNLFLTGDNGTGAVTGRGFDENVKEGPENLFFADVVRGTQPKRRSAVTFAGSDPIPAVEAFYAQSEQRGARYFQLGEEDFALVAEHPDCDLKWFQGLTPEKVSSLEQTETLALLERRVYRWHCGCNQERMMEVLTPTMKQDPEALFGGDPKLEIRCPRCGARHMITREALEAFVARAGWVLLADGGMGRCHRPACRLQPAYVNEILRNIWTGLTTATALDQVNLVLGIVGVGLMIRRTLWAFPVGLLSVTVQGILFWRAKFPADALLQVFVFVTLAWGWWHWVRDRGAAPELPVTTLSWRGRGLIAGLALAAMAAWAPTVGRWTGALMPWRDAFIAAFSVAAQVLQARKKLENWAVWTAVNIVAVGSYWSAELAYTAFLYAVYLVLGLIGWRAWWRASRRQSIHG